MKRTDENHSFNIHIATILKGHVKKAILLKEIYGWVYLNGLKDKNVKHGIVWTYMSADSFAEKFPYMDKKSIARWLKDLEKKGWLYSGNFNQKAYDKTKWYTINSKRYDDSILKILHSIPQIEKWTSYIEKCITQNEQSISQIEEPIPTTTQLLPNNNNSIEEKTKIKDLERDKKDLQKQLEEALKNQKPKQKRKMFLAPTLEATIEYFLGKDSTEQEAETFWYFYECKGWMVGKNKMKKWEAAASQWIARNKKQTPNGTPIKSTPLPQRYSTYLKKYIEPKILRVDYRKYEALYQLAAKSATASQLDTLKAKLNGITNPTFNDCFVFDVCFGTLAKRAGTQPDRRIGEFKTFYGKLSDYNKNKGELRPLFKKHLIKKFG